MFSVQSRDSHAHLEDVKEGKLISQEDKVSDQIKLRKRAETDHIKLIKHAYGPFRSLPKIHVSSLTSSLDTPSQPASPQYVQLQRL